MVDSETDDGVIAALVERFLVVRMPRALEIRRRVSAGGVLSDSDIAFLDGVFSDFNLMMPLADGHPEFRSLISRVSDLYLDITTRALENERART